MPLQIRFQVNGNSAEEYGDLGNGIRFGALLICAAPPPPARSNLPLFLTLRAGGAERPLRFGEERFQHLMLFDEEDEDESILAIHLHDWEQERLGARDYAQLNLGRADVGNTVFVELGDNLTLACQVVLVENAQERRFATAAATPSSSYRRANNTTQYWISMRAPRTTGNVRARVEGSPVHLSTGEFLGILTRIDELLGLATVVGLEHDMFYQRRARTNPSREQMIQSLHRLRSNAPQPEYDRHAAMRANLAQANLFVPDADFYVL